MNYTGISVDPDKSMIYASDTCWKERENVSVEAVPKDLETTHGFL
ncbi:unnamed protein product [Brassica rapa subsp. narinosa]